MRFICMLVAVLAVSACSSSNDEYMGSRDDIIIENQKAVKAQKKAENDIKIVKEKMTTTTVETVNGEMTSEVQDVSDQIAQEVGAMDTTTMTSPKPVEPKPIANHVPDVPPNARPGECYAKVLVPAVTETVTERIQVSEEQKVLARIVPARYETHTERVKVSEARKYWKQGRGPVEKINTATGEILCLVEEPAQYKTVEKRVMVAPERPEYKVVPAQYDTITKTNVIQSEYWQWQRILCETNVTAETIAKIQRALESKGYSVGPIDGVLGGKTMNAIRRYQARNGLASRGITYETLDHLGVELATAS